VASALAGTGLARWLRSPSGPAGGPTEAPAKPVPFARWDKPDLVLVLSGQQNGYLLPCGCSRPQVGGLERRYNFLRGLEEKGWKYVAVDLGDVPQRRGPVSLPNLQGLVKYRYSMIALDRMGYAAIGFGQHEAALPLSAALAEWALNHKPLVAANLLKREENFPFQTKDWQEVAPPGTGIRVGVTAVIGPTVEEQIIGPEAALKLHDLKLKRARAAGPAQQALDKQVQAFRESLPAGFGDTVPALNAVLGKMDADKVDLRVLLYQGLVSRNDLKRPPTEALACAEAYPQFPIVLCLSQEDEPPSAPFEVVHPATKAKSLVLCVGRKGKGVGVVGVYKTGNAAQPYRFRYQWVEMTEDYLTPEAKAKDHPIQKLMEAYTAELKRDDYLNRYGQVSHRLQMLGPVKEGGKELADRKGSTRPTYVGTEACKRCHADAYETWKKSGHAHAYHTLEEARRPALRQYDPECIVCHTVGFGYEGGFQDAAKTKHLKDVGCESCHGPASIHMANPRNEEWHRRLNPSKYAPAAQRARMIDEMCQRCHDIDNDVHWMGGGLRRKWPLIEHMVPGGETPPVFPPGPKPGK
jgi:hypothetical protein